MPLVAGALALALLVAPIGFGRSELAKSVENALHVPLFAVLAFLAAIGLRAWRERQLSRRDHLVVLIAMVAFGAVGELAQSFTAGRTAQWIDLFNDTLGAVAGLAVYTARAKQFAARRSWVVVAIATLLAIGPVLATSRFYVRRWNQLPELVTWSGAGMHFLGGSAQSRVELLPSQWARHTSEQCLLVLPRVRGGDYSSVEVRELWPDWQAYKNLTIDIANPNERALSLTLRIDDAHHNNSYNDRYNGVHVVEPGARANVIVPIDTIVTTPMARPLDASAISRLVLFQATETAGEFYLCGLRLEG